MRTDYIIYDEVQLIAEVYTGRTTLDSISKHKKILREDQMYNDTFDVIIDVRYSQVDVLVNDLKRFFLDYQDKYKVFLKHKTVFVINTHNQLAYTVLLKQFSAAIEKNIFITTNIADALDKLDRSVSTLDVLSDMNKMRYNPRYFLGMYEQEESYRY